MSIPGLAGLALPIKNLAVLTLIVIIIIVLVEPRIGFVCAAIAAVVGFYVAVVASDKEKFLTYAPACAANRLAESGFDRDLIGATDSEKTGGFCPAGSLGQQAATAGSKMEAGALNILNGKEGEDNLVSGKEGFAGRREGFSGRPEGFTGGDKEHFSEGFPIPGKHPPYAVAAPPPGQDPLYGAPPTYKGAIEVGDYDVDSQGSPVFVEGADETPDLPAEGFDMTADDAWDQGHHDRLRDEYTYVPEGNPFDLMRGAAPESADACTDDEANDDNYDIDERNTYQARSRNDETRVAAGTMRRRREMDKYFREELDERADAYWWGRHDL